MRTATFSSVLSLRGIALTVRVATPACAAKAAYTFSAPEPEYSAYRAACESSLDTVAGASHAGFCVRPLRGTGLRVLAAID
jgi:hypothetical protein